MTSGEAREDLGLARALAPNRPASDRTEKPKNYEAESQHGQTAGADDAARTASP